MTKTVTGGIIRRQAEKNLYAVEVDTVTFATLQQTQVPAAGDQAIIIVKRVPNTPYANGDTLFYQDSNHHNDTDFTVVSVIGPAKYKVQVT